MIALVSMPWNFEFRTISVRRSLIESSNNVSRIKQGFSHRLKKLIICENLGPIRADIKILTLPVPRIFFRTLYGINGFHKNDIKMIFAIDLLEVTRGFHKSLNYRRYRVLTTVESQNSIKFYLNIKCISTARYIHINRVEPHFK